MTYIEDAIQGRLAPGPEDEAAKHVAIRFVRLSVLQARAGQAVCVLRPATPWR